MLLATTASMIGALLDVQGGRHIADRFLHAAFVLALGAPLVAAALGFLQSVLEVRRDQWAFLMHRGVSSTGIFLAKAGAGLAFYAVVTLASALLAALWITSGGIDRFPFSWYHTLPTVAVIIASASFYFAAMLAVVWRGPGYFSRALPLVAPALLVVGTIGMTSEVSEYIPAWLIACAVLVDIVLAVAAWGVFVRSGESAGRPRPATVCLGLTIAVPVLAAGFCLASGTVGLVYDWLLPGFFGRRVGNCLVDTDFWLNRDGHILRIESELDIDVRGRLRYRRSRVVDLDDPRSERTEQSPGALDAEGIAGDVDADLLEMISIPKHKSGAKRWPRERILKRLHQTPTEGGSIHWIYSSADELIYGYFEEHFSWENFWRWSSPKLVYVLGPDGFTGPSDRPSRRFGAFRMEVIAFHRENSWEFNDRRALPNVERRHLLFDTGLFAFDFTRRRVNEVLRARDEKPIESIFVTEVVVAVLYDDLVDVHSIAIEGDLDLPGEIRQSVRMPAEIAPFDQFAFGRDSKGTMHFAAWGGIRTWNLRRFVEIGPDGTVRTRDFLDPDGIHQAAWPALCGIAALLPPGPTLVLAAIDAADQFATGVGAGVLVRLWRDSPTGTMIALVILAASAAGSVWSARRTVRRYGLERRARIAWTSISLLFGPAGLFTLWCLRDWPALETCANCRKLRPVDRDECPNCGEPVAPPVETGAEIVIVGRQSAFLVGS